jgi:hypothetical protein
MVKLGVQYSLWGGSVVNLGTEQHKRKYFDDIATFRLPGCFAMTELKHGSNVAGLQTEAVLDLATGRRVVRYALHTDGRVLTPPSLQTSGWCIRRMTGPSSGGSAMLQRMASESTPPAPCSLLRNAACQHAHMHTCAHAHMHACTHGAPCMYTLRPQAGGRCWSDCFSCACTRAATVFARLQIPAADAPGALKDYGVHAFIVPIRDDAGALMPGVEIHDCGYKV